MSTNFWGGLKFLVIIYMILAWKYLRMLIRLLFLWTSLLKFYFTDFFHIFYTYQCSYYLKKALLFSIYFYHIIDCNWIWYLTLASYPCMLQSLLCTETIYKLYWACLFEKILGFFIHIAGKFPFDILEFTRISSFCFIISTF